MTGRCRPASTEISYDAAVAIMKARAVNFHHAFRFLPKARFRGVAALYAFCRAADDISDGDAAGDAMERLDALEKVIVRFFEAGRKPGCEPVGFEGAPWWAALEDAIVRFDVPVESFLRQIEGQRMDAAFGGIRDADELVRYARLVAGSVGTMLLPLLSQDGINARNPEFIRACENLGVGMQITNILRDVGEDLRLRNRIYLPADMLDAHGISREQLMALAFESEESLPSVPQGFIGLWEALAQMAEPYYRDYENWLCHFHPACRVPLVAAARIYRAIADAVRAASYDCFTRRCYTSAQTRDQIVKEARSFVRLNAY